MAAMSRTDSYSHVRAESPFVDDLPEPRGTLHLAVLASPTAHGIVRGLKIDAALAAPGVAGVLTASDIPGENQVGIMADDEPLLAVDRVHYVGHPLAIVAADTPARARQALARIEVAIDPLPAVFDPRQAAAKGDLLTPPRTVSMGDVDAVWAQCTTIVSGRVDTGAQAHVYLETQSALAIPQPRGRMHIFASTQSPSTVQRTVAQVLGCPMHAIAVEVGRVGGAFGGKEAQATPWAAMAALAAHRLQRPVKLVLDRKADMQMTGKRHPYSSDYRLGLDADGRFLAFQATYYQNAGAFTDLSPAVLERSLFHATNSYAIANVRVSGKSCRTNLPPFTAFRGFGAPQAMVVIEAAIAAAAEKTGMPTWTLQRKNLLRPGTPFPYGMHMDGDATRRSFDAAVSQFDLESRYAENQQRNQASPFVKHGLAVMPVCFGIAFTTTMLNQAAALVHIYNDGSVSVSTAAVELGQDVNRKLRTIVATALGIDRERIQIESTSTMRVANTAPTAASTAADLNGTAARMACKTLRSRLTTLAAELEGVPATQITIREERIWIGDQPGSLTWTDLVQTAHSNRIDLSAHAFYATPNLHYDRQQEKGRPFAYHVCGTAVIEARLDVMRGTASIESVQIVHDAGRSLDLLVDRGQVEGAVVQGIGWCTMEEVVYDGDGRLLSDTLTTYKVPDIYSAPEKFEVVFFEEGAKSGGVMDSKAVGEPPFMYGIGAFFAIRAAIRTLRDIPSDRIQAPLTGERILRLLDGE